MPRLRSASARGNGKKRKKSRLNQLAKFLEKKIRLYSIFMRRDDRSVSLVVHRVLDSSRAT